ncbi:low specificity L-threonine aldolase [Streptomyces sp. NA04227]|uniref:low specificity L-threonine aldolase n=1 Tax=Streptomyces sp. NA04227 TaxID=2742136 RepID=UPI0034CFDC93
MSGGAAGGEDPAEISDSDAARERRFRAARGAERALWRPAAQRTVRERLEELAALANCNGTEDTGARDTPDTHDAYGLDSQVDIYGDGIIHRLEKRVATLLGTEAAAFFPTGTMAQQVALRCWASRTGSNTVALHPLAHPEIHERDALSALSGLRTIHPTSAPRLPSAAEIESLQEPFGTLMLELPLREAGFVLPTWEELTATVEAARERDAVVHLDGARLWECTTHFGRPLDEIAALADTVYVSFYKSLEGLSGAALAGPRTLIDEAVTWRHRYGGQLFQQFPAAASALSGLDTELPRLPSYVEHARVVAAAMDTAFGNSELGWHRVHPRIPHTHQFQLWLPYSPELLNEVSVTMAEQTGTALFRHWGTTPTAPPGVACTEVTVARAGLEWTEAEVAEAVGEFVRRVREVDGEG